MVTSVCPLAEFTSVARSNATGVKRFKTGEYNMKTTSAEPDKTNAVVDHFDHLSATGSWSHLYSVADGFTYHFHVRRQRVLELLPESLGRVADVGCGPGVMVEAVLRRGGVFEGVDLSPEMVREAQRKFGHLDAVSFREGSIEALTLPDEGYDQALCMAVIEYLSTPRRAMSEIARILKPGGIAIVTVPKRWHIDQVMVAATAPMRALGRLFAQGTADSLPRLRLQPEELDLAAAEAGLIPDGGSQYQFTPIPYPVTRIAPNPCMRMNLPFEKWHATRNAFPSFFAHGYVGRYRKPE
jgi:ubiquinone/menaquinone biosynthesis C-methylase UbiE